MLLEIRTREAAEALQNKLEQAGQVLAEEGLLLELSCRAQPSEICLDCYWDDTQLADKERWLMALSRAITYWLIETKEDTLVRQWIARRYRYFSLGEQERIWQRAMALRIQDDGGKRQRRETILCEEVRQFLQTGQAVVVEGLLRFRLRRYQHEVVKLLDRAVDAYLLDREYDAFIRSLRQLMERQAVRPAALHLIWREDGDYHLLCYSNGRYVTIDEAEEMAGCDGRWSRDERLLILLLRMAPQQLIWHAETERDDTEGLQMALQGVFRERLQYCSGCSFCRQPTPH